MGFEQKSNKLREIYGMHAHMTLGGGGGYCTWGGGLICTLHRDFSEGNCRQHYFGPILPPPYKIKNRMKTSKCWAGRQCRGNKEFFAMF